MLRQDDSEISELRPYADLAFKSIALTFDPIGMCSKWHKSHAFTYIESLPSSVSSDINFRSII